MAAPHVLMMVESVPLSRDTRLRRQARALLAAGYRVTVICPRDPGNAGLVPGVRLLEYPQVGSRGGALGYAVEYGYSWLMAAWRAGRLYLTDRFDVLQIASTPDIYFTIGAPLRMLGVPLILDQRDQSPLLYERRYGHRGGVHRLLLWLERSSYRAADHVLTVNEMAKEYAAATGNLRPGTITVIGNGPALTDMRMRPPVPALRQGRAHLCCWVGMMGPQDQLGLAMRVVHHLVTVLGRTDCQFAFVGDGDAREETEKLAASLGITGWVTFPGWLSQDEAFDYVATADLGIEPNLDDIVSPVKGLEFMAFGLPFAAFDLRETRAVAANSAAYAAPGDVAGLARLVDELLSDPERLERMGRIGRQRIETRLAWEHQAEAYLRVFSALSPTGRTP
ncbi:glycosyltransferase family 4 protein [Longispora albida]|uniref:glycosyltransferase family 4 protein n=1 Tax=Longispora albida TaxID=203523 RepID=UPI00035E4364|nr:glycosyltransferase family 4 protein [Longispora albida]